MWETSNPDPQVKKKVGNTVLAVDTWRHYLAIGSTSIQLIDLNDTNWSRIITEEVENAEVCCAISIVHVPGICQASVMDVVYLHLSYRLLTVFHLPRVEVYWDRSE